MINKKTQPHLKGGAGRGRSTQQVRLSPPGPGWTLPWRMHTETLLTQFCCPWKTNASLPPQTYSIHKDCSCQYFLFSFRIKKGLKPKGLLRLAIAFLMAPFFINFTLPSNESIILILLLRERIKIKWG